MKKSLLCLFAIVVMTLPAFGDGFYGIHSPNGVDVWAVGNSGTIFHSFNGGVTWTSSTLGTATLRAVYAMPPNVWIAGDNGTTYSSTDGGSTWNQQTVAGGASLRSISFINSSTGIIVGGNGTIEKTTNAGSDWAFKSSPSSQLLNSVTFADPLTGYVAGNAGTLLKTTDAGETWTSIAAPGWTKDILSVSVSGLTVYVAGADGFCYKSVNGGTTWTVLNFRTDTNVDVDAVFAVSPSDAYFTGGGGFIRKTVDAGASYAYGLHQMHAKLNSLYFYNATKGWACSEKNNAVLRTTDGGATWQLPQGTTVNYQWVNKVSGGSIGNTFCVNALNKNIIYVVLGSTVYMSGDRGETWTSIASISGGGSTWSFYVSPRDTNIWIAATSGGGKGVWRTTNHGSTWTKTLTRNFTSYGMPLEMDPDNTESVVFAAEGTGSGPDGILYLSRDFGATWDTLAQTSFRSPCDIMIVPGNTDLWYVADGVTGSGQAQMWRSTNYGRNWTSIYSTGSSEIPMIAVCRLRNDYAYATAWSGTSYTKTTNAGVSWTPIASTSSTWGTDVAKDDPNVVIYGTYGGGTSYLSTNAGGSFTATSLSGSNSGMLAYDRATILAHQASGGVWKYNITYIVPTSTQQALTLISPAGGEEWACNSLQNITWSAGNIASVKIEYRTSPGGPWQTIASNVQGSLGTYAWVVPGTPTTQARVRISEASDGNPIDSSSTDFSFVTLASVAVISPNGGETWQVNSVHNIMWTSTLVDQVNLLYRVLPGNNWRTIQTNLPAATGSYSWAIPASPGPALVRIVSASDGAILDESDSPFTIEATTSVTELGGIPTSFELGQNYPNPFNPSTQISYGLPKDAHVTLTVFNSLGQEVVRLIDQNQPAGRYTVHFGGTDTKGRALSSGIYYYSLRAGDFTNIKRMMLVK